MSEQTCSRYILLLLPYYYICTSSLSQTKANIDTYIQTRELFLAHNTTESFSTRLTSGIGREDPQKERLRREEAIAEKKTQKVEELMVEFGCRQKSQWRSRRILVNFNKAKAALSQLENKDVLEPEKNSDEEDGDGKEEEEEEEITEEDLQDILMKLRDEHQYCLFCGCKYESVEALLSNCPGTNEDDH